MDTRLVDWTAVPQEEVFPGIFRQTVTGSESTLVRYTYHPGCVFPTHSHPEEQITVVQSGEIQFDVAGETRVVRAGQVAIIPGGTPHGARVIDSRVVVTDNYLPSANRTPIAYQTDQ